METLIKIIIWVEHPEKRFNMMYFVVYYNREKKTDVIVPFMTMTGALVMICELVNKGIRDSKIIRGEYV